MATIGTPAEPNGKDTGGALFKGDKEEETGESKSLEELLDEFDEDSSE